MSVGILDTSVVVDLGRLDVAELPDEQAITSITLAESSVGPLIASDPTVAPLAAVVDVAHIEGTGAGEQPVSYPFGTMSACRTEPTANRGSQAKC